VDAVLLRPLPFPEPERLVMVWNQLPGQGPSSSGKGCGWCCWVG
jgi:hypothetical protein